MGTTWFPPGWTLDVPNPGYGELVVEAPRHPHTRPALVVEDWLVQLDGPEIGVFLSQVTAVACDLGDPDPLGGRLGTPERGWRPGRPLPSFVTPHVARRLLPALQQAVVYAVAGGERFERTFADADEPPDKPYCVNCGEGSPYAPGASTSAWCEQHGHHAYGMGAKRRWDIAQQEYRWRREQWERDQDRRRADEEFSAAIRALGTATPND